jgi:hypothetical protein
MHATTVTHSGTVFGTYQEGALVSGPRDEVIWTCGHVHVPSIYIVVSQVAQDCADYERQRRMRRGY